MRAGVSGLRKGGGIGIVAVGRSGSGQSVRRHGSDKLRHATNTLRDERTCVTESCCLRVEPADTRAAWLCVSIIVWVLLAGVGEGGETGRYANCTREKSRVLGRVV